MTRIFLLFYLLFSLMLSASMGGGSFRRYSKTSGNIQWTYSPLGDRLSAKYSAGSTAVEEKYSYFGDNLFEIRKGTDLQKVISGPGVDEIFGIIARSGDRYFCRDYQGSVKVITDKSGNIVRIRSYRAFGEEASGETGGYGYTSREFDETAGLYYYRSRYYDPQTGRFTQRDFYNEEGMIFGIPWVRNIPGQLNDWTYTWNNPLNMTDPAGSNPITKIAGKIVKLAKKGLKKISRSLSYDDLLKSGKEGEDILAKNRKIAKEIATGIGNGKQPIHDAPHGSIENGFRPHYHPYGRPGNHIFYSIASGLTLSFWAEGRGEFIEYAAEIGDLIQPLSMFKDLLDIISKSEVSSEKDKTCAKGE